MKQWMPTNWREMHSKRSEIKRRGMGRRKSKTKESHTVISDEI